MRSKSLRSNNLLTNKVFHRITQQNQIIENATRTVAETEEVAIEITQELGRNREKIESAHNKV